MSYWSFRIQYTMHLQIGVFHCRACTFFPQGHSSISTLEEFTRQSLPIFFNSFGPFIEASLSVKCLPLRKFWGSLRRIAASTCCDRSMFRDVQKQHLGAAGTKAKTIVNPGGFVERSCWGASCWYVGRLLLPRVFYGKDYNSWVP